MASLWSSWLLSTNLWSTWLLSIWCRTLIVVVVTLIRDFDNSFCLFTFISWSRRNMLFSWSLSLCYIVFAFKSKFFAISHAFKIFNSIFYYIFRLISQYLFIIHLITSLVKSCNIWWNPSGTGYFCKYFEAILYNNNLYYKLWYWWILKFICVYISFIMILS